MKVLSKQTNSKYCIICGMDNAYGVKAQFYNMEDDSIGCLLTYIPEHQSYPGRVHGGMVSALLDELIGRALWVNEPEAYGVTTSLDVSFRKPVPYNTPLKARATLTYNSSRGFYGEGYLYDMDGKILAQASAKYLKLPAKLISTDTDINAEMCYNVKDDIAEIDFPEILKK